METTQKYNVVIRRYINHEFVSKMNKRPRKFEQATLMADRAAEKACHAFHQEMYIHVEKA